MDRLTERGLKVLEALGRTMAPVKIELLLLVEEISGLEKMQSYLQVGGARS